MAKARVHTLILRISFDKPCTRAHAVREARDCIHGEFYPTAYERSDPESFKVKSIASAKEGRRNGG